MILIQLKEITVKQIMIFLMLFALMGFSGCSYKAPQPSAPISWVFECEETIRYIDKVVEVNIEVMCEVKDTFCSKQDSLKEGTIEELMSCIHELRESNKTCEKN